MTTLADITPLPVERRPFRRYDHLERLGHQEVEGLLDGKTYVFPKLDGTNASIWHDGREVRCGSRNRELTVESDNHGFAAWANSAHAEGLREFLRQNTDLVLYGEWLVPHTLKTYRDEAWRRFWVFDVFDRQTGRYVAFDAYFEHLHHRCDLLQPLCKIDHPSQAQLQAQVEANTYLVRDGAGVGEGVVVKRYDWVNRHGRQPWAKLVRNEFREANAREFRVPDLTSAFEVEAAIAEQFVTPTLVGKTRTKVVADVANEAGIDLMDPNAQQRVEAEFRHRVIPQLLGRVFHDLVVEESWAFLKAHDFPSVDFGRLRKMTITTTKKLAQDLFA
jgi:RNA ligase-like protein